MSIEAQIPGSQGNNEAGLGWLLQPGWGKDLFGEVAAAKQTTPEVLRAMEGILAATKEKAPPIGKDDYCTSLEKCGNFGGACPSLKECGTFSHRVMEKELE